MLEQIISHPVASLFLIVALGTALGKVRLGNLTLGSSAVLLVALVFGHFGFRIPAEVQDLGIILFVYAVGLQAGPRFFNQFKRRGLVFAKIGMGVVASGALLTWLATKLFHLAPALAIGMYAGAMTSTPGLAAAMDAAGDPRVSLGYGIAYPLGMAGVVLFVQLLPRLLRVNLQQEEERVKQGEPSDRNVQRRQFRVTNPSCAGKTLHQLQLHRFSTVNISRISREGKVKSPDAATELRMGDIVLAVGQEAELDKLQLIIGEETQQEGILETREVIARDVFVSNERMTGRSLAELGIFEHYNVVITRVFRDDMEFVPTGTFILEIGDSIRVTGSKEACERFVADVGQREKRIYETNILALSLGIFLGVVLGFKSFSLPGGASFRLGMAGGPLFVALVLAHFGRIGHLNIRTPYGAKYIMRELGLVLFLAGAGTAAGGAFTKVLAEHWVIILATGLMITLGSALAGLMISRWVFRLDLLTVLGALCGGMTSTPALGALTDMTDSGLPLTAYTAVYPVALIMITVFCQFLFFLL